MMNQCDSNISTLIPNIHLTKRWRQNHWLNLWLTKADHSIGTKRTPQHDAKSKTL